MPYNYVADGFHTSKLCSRFLFKRSAILHGKLPFCGFELCWGLGTTYDVHLRLTGKRAVDFLLVLIELYV